MMRDLFADDENALPGRENLAAGAVLMRGKALPLEDELLSALAEVTRESPFRQMTTPGGIMSVAMTNCGAAGWMSDRSGCSGYPRASQRQARSNGHRSADCRVEQTQLPPVSTR